MVVVVVSVTVVPNVLVTGGGVIVVIGVYVVLTVALLVKVNAIETVGTGLRLVLPSSVVHACNDLVESATTRKAP